MTNKEKFYSLPANTIYTIPLTNYEIYPLITCIEREIQYRLSRGLSTENGNDIIALRNTLENIKNL